MANDQRSGSGGTVNGRSEWREQPGSEAAAPAPADGEAWQATRPQPVAERTPAAIPTTYPVFPMAPAEPLRDQVRWGPIFAGFLSALTALVMLTLLGAAVGLTVLGGRVGTASASGTLTWAAVAAIIAFLIGGFVAGRTAATVGRGAAAFNGAMVFVLAVPVALWLAGQGLGAAVRSVGLGTFGGSAGGFGGGFGSGAVRLAANGARISAWAVLIAIAVGLLAGALGGAIGSHRSTHRSGTHGANT